MSLFSIIMVLLKVVNFVIHRINLNEGMRAQIALERDELDRTLAKDKVVIAEVDKKSEAEVDEALRKRK